MTDTPESKVERLDKHVTTWHQAALTIGEFMGSVGPDNYYDFTPEQWFSWAREVLRQTLTRMIALEKDGPLVCQDREIDRLQARVAELEDRLSEMHHGPPITKCISEEQYKEQLSSRDQLLDEMKKMWEALASGACEKKGCSVIAKIALRKLRYIKSVVKLLPCRCTKQETCIECRGKTRIEKI